MAHYQAKIITVPGGTCRRWNGQSPAVVTAGYVGVVTFEATEVAAPLGP